MRGPATGSYHFSFIYDQLLSETEHRYLQNGTQGSEVPMWGHGRLRYEGSVELGLYSKLKEDLRRGKTVLGTHRFLPSSPWSGSGFSFSVK